MCRYYSKDISASTKKEAQEFQRLLAELVNWGLTPFLQDFIPFLRPVMHFISSDEYKMAKAGKQIQVIFQTILEEHRQRQNTNESSQDFVDVMLQSVGEDGKHFDDKTIKSVTLVSSHYQNFQFQK